MACETLTTLFRDISKNDAILITVNQRLASLRQREYDHWQQAQGKQSWQTPLITPLNRWLKNNWQMHCQQEQRLLDPFSSQQIWQSIIENRQPEFLQIENSAQLAANAWTTLQLWQLNLESLKPAFNEQVAEFIIWATEFEQQCQQQQWCDQNQIAVQLHAYLLQNKLPWPKQIYLDGFDDLPPLIASIFEIIAQSIPVTHYHPSANLAKPSQTRFADGEQEIWHMAAWAKSLYEEDPTRQIGCIVPNLQAIRNQVAAIFTKVFDDENIFFNISAGQKLSEFNLIRVAEQILMLIKNSCTMTELSQLLQSPYLCQNEYDKSYGAKIAAEILNLDIIELPLAELFSALNQHFEQYPDSTWLTRWRAFYSLSRETTDRKASEWATHFYACLQAIGWPGGRKINSMEYQLLQRFMQLFAELGRLDAVFNKISLGKALKLMSELIENTIFQTQSKNTPVQILGILESVGYEFDACWMMGLTDEMWPPAPSPNPYLPFSLQMQHKMPHSTAQRELVYTQNIMNRLLKSAKQIIFSAPLKEGDKHLLASHFIRDYPLIDLKITKPKTDAELLLASHNIEFLDDQMAPTITNDELIRGGSWIIKQQALCPFRAFASVRLKAATLAQPELGLSAKDRGILLHHCLDQIWATLKDHATLCSFNSKKLQQLILEIVEQVIQNYKNQKHYASNKFLALESQRLQLLLMKWLEYEKERLPFTVLQTESRFRVQIGQLNLHLQVDRIDQLENGETVIIDYKTGYCHISHWFSNRPQEPQLPIYCAFTQIDASTTYSGMSFAQIQAQQNQFKGVINQSSTEAERCLPGISALSDIDYQPEFSWEQTLQNWRQIMHKLSDDFFQGIATVDPVEPQTCTTCDLQPLCRKPL